VTVGAPARVPFLDLLPTYTELREELDARGVVFAGDDRTDEEVFAAIDGGGCTIRVGPGPTAARHRLAGPPDVLRFLRALAALV